MRGRAPCAELPVINSAKPKKARGNSEASFPERRRTRVLSPTQLSAADSTQPLNFNFPVSQTAKLKFRRCIRINPDAAGTDEASSPGRRRTSFLSRTPPRRFPPLSQIPTKQPPLPQKRRKGGCLFFYPIASPNPSAQPLPPHRRSKTPPPRLPSRTPPARAPRPRGSARTQGQEGSRFQSPPA